MLPPHIFRQTFLTLDIFDDLLSQLTKENKIWEDSRAL